MSKQILSILIYILIIAPAVYLLLIYSKLPQQVPVHFGLDGQPDRFGSKNELIWTTAFLTAVNFGIYLLLTNIQKIDPKKAAGQSKEIMQKIALAVVLLMSGICVMVIHSASKGTILFDKLFVPALGLFFAWLGYLMKDIKPNYFVGMRTPWTLENEETWKATHKLASKQWLFGGLMIALLGVILPFKYSIIALVAIVLTIVIIPFVYSYRHFQKIKNKK